MTATKKHTAALSISEVFLQAPLCSDDEHVPFTPFMIHIWQRNGLKGDPSVRPTAEQKSFVYWFYDTYHRRLAPYRWPVPREVLRWLNYPALSLPPDGALHQKHYLSRFMQHVWENYRKDLDVLHGDGYLKFLTWFALDCVPRWNLPPSFLPDDLLPVLNCPVRTERLPMTTAMLVDGLTRSRQRYEAAREASDEVFLAMAFELLTDISRAGDPRLVPEFVSRFWFRRLSAEANELNAYEYLAMRAYASDHSNIAAVRQWLVDRYLRVFPQADSFIMTPTGDSRNQAVDCSHSWPHHRTVFVYRDHRTIAGLSTAGRFTHDALVECGLPVVDLDFSFGRDRMKEEYLHNALLPGGGQRPSLHVLHLNPEYVPECLMSHLSRMGEHCYLIGHFAWELSDISPVHECGLALVDEIWVPSAYVKEIYQKRIDVPIHVMGHAVEPLRPDPRFTRAAFGLPDDTYIFLVSFDAGSIVERKNPLAAVRAFCKAFPAGTEKTIMLLKTRNTGACQTDRDRDHWRQTVKIAGSEPRIRILEQTMSAMELNAMYGVSDCYVSLHRSEGFGFGPAEAMGLGKPVIATGYSGVMEFCTPETAALVSYKLEDVALGSFPFMDEGRVYQWASPDIDVAAFHMRRLYNNPDLGRALGTAGRHLIANQFSKSALRQRFAVRLSELGWLQS